VPEARDCEDHDQRGDEKYAEDPLRSSGMEFVGHTPSISSGQRRRQRSASSHRVLNSRKMGNSTSVPLYRFDVYEADVRSGELRKNGERLRIQEQPFQVLIALLERPREVVTRDELRQRLWPSDTFVDFDHGLNTTINKLRESLGDSASNPRFIETLPRRGYRFVSEVENIAVENSLSAADPSEAPTGEFAIPSTAATEDVGEGERLKPTPPQHDLPEIHPKRATTLFAALQVMYVVFYVIALWRLDEAGWRMERYLGLSARTVIITVMVSAAVGLALRLYTLSQVAFRYRWLGRNFRRIFPIVLIVDVVWAFAPFFLIHLIGIGLAFAASAALVYSPFAQRVLATLAHPVDRH
jgi:cholera toxin transcriptional activator